MWILTEFIDDIKKLFLIFRYNKVTVDMVFLFLKKRALIFQRYILKYLWKWLGIWDLIQNNTGGGSGWEYCQNKIGQEFIIVDENIDFRYDILSIMIP